jgi:hypothetical protein
MWPRPAWVGVVASALQPGATLSAGTHRWATSFRIPKDGTLEKFGVMLHNAPGTASTLRFSFQDPDTSTNAANPDGTVDESQTMSSGTTSAWLTPTTAMTNGGIKRVVTAGQRIFCVVDVTSYGGASFSFSYFGNGSSNGAQFTELATAYAKHYNGSAWGNGNWYEKYYSPVIALEYDDGTFARIPGAYAISVGESWSGTLTSPNAYGAKIIYPFGGTVTGVWWRGYGLWANTAISIYDAASPSTPLWTSGTLVLYEGSGGFFGPPGAAMFLPIDNLALPTGTYYVVEEPASADGARILYVTLPSAVHRQAFEGGENICYTSRSGAAPGTYTDVTTRIPEIGLQFSELDLAGGGGGGGETSHVFVG